ncbi:MAG TPA: undecaprenyl-diphosphate phosphatase [Bacteroidales bacterium]|jgi:undecaprenyl-diphosphatase|nr:undecaprenyl-diphosphate phosphatase [Bacteroidales bacterium]HOU97418.1 undecaprenyl-diphosphate phosphatase [Bacteroidales bacterium]
MNWFDVIVLAIVEGLTEFLPVSSTGHMIIAQHMLGMESSEFLRTFIVNIQFGAILSVVVLYYKRFFKSLNFYYKLLVAFLPAAVIGFLLGDYIDALLENVIVVAIALLIGGIIFLFVDFWFKNSTNDQEPTYKNALMVGLFQCIAMVPGVSRSAATIIGGLTQKLSRKSAAEFSFFLAVPTMFAASAYKLLKTYTFINGENLKYLLVGNLVSFIVAMAAIKFFIYFLTKYGFKWFGWYRIIIGILILVMIKLGYSLAVV